MPSKLRFLFILVAVSFALHFLWENSHVSLYGGYENLSPYLPITFWATIGDVSYTLGVFFLFALLKRNLAWFEHLRLRDFAIFSCIGFVISLFVEYKALALNRWFYLPAMPIIPFLNVGLTPAIQMTLLLPLSFLITAKVNKYFA